MDPDHILQYGGGRINLFKSPNLIALKAKPGEEETLEAILASPNVAAGAVDRLGDYYIADVREMPAGANEGLEMLRADPSVAVGSHVYHTGPDLVPFIPTGIVYVVFKTAATDGERRALLK